MWSTILDFAYNHEMFALSIYKKTLYCLAIIDIYRERASVSRPIRHFVKL